jgi:hypothetical protein
MVIGARDQRHYAGELSMNGSKVREVPLTDNVIVYCPEVR